MFNAGLEDVFQRLEWEAVGLRINGENISHLRFADDIVLIGNTSSELQTMINQLNEESNKLGMKMNLKKTKVMFNKFTRQAEVQVNGAFIKKLKSMCT